PKMASCFAAPTPNSDICVIRAIRGSSVAAWPRLGPDFDFRISAVEMIEQPVKRSVPFFRRVVGAGGDFALDALDQFGADRCAGGAAFAFGGRRFGDDMLAELFPPAASAPERPGEGFMRRHVNLLARRRA